MSRKDKRRSNRRHRAWAVAAGFVLGGFAITVVLSTLCTRGVAWRQGPFRETHVASTGETVYVHPKTGLFIHSWRRPFGLDTRFPDVGDIESVYKAAPSKPFVGEVGSTGSVSTPEAWWPTPSPDVISWGVYRYRVGFPMPALRYHMHAWQPVSNAPQYKIKEAFEINNLPVIGSVYLPYRPVFPGFLVNWLVWTGAIWLAWRLARGCARWSRERKRRRRASRQECLACGYHIQELNQCPECGAITPPASSSA